MSVSIAQVQNFITGIADSGRELLERSRRKANIDSADADVSSAVADLRGLCIDLLSQKGEALGTALAREVVTAYQQLDQTGQLAFFRMLRDDFGADLSQVDAAVNAYRDDPGEDTVRALSQAVETPRRKLLRAINMAPNGTAAVIEMREHLLRLLDTDAALRGVDGDFVQPLSSWFNRGFLRLERINWRTPAHILEKLIEYESVHEIQGWDDLRRRLDDDRRCFAFFHPALPDEPLVFVEVALCSGLADAIQPLLATDGERGQPDKADTAIFYSINNCQFGLRGISFGNFLIKQVVAELAVELPGLKQFATLSPVPRFRRWVDLQRSDADADAADFGLDEQQFASLALLDQPNWHQDQSCLDRLKKPLLNLCAYYLAVAKYRGRPMDRVARFHLGNGALLEQINWLGDVSENGIERSLGVLVNYRYDLKKIVEHHEIYQNNGDVACSRSVQRLVAVKT